MTCSLGVASMGRMKKDWIEQVNDLADKLRHDDRFVLEFKFYAAKTVEDNG